MKSNHPHSPSQTTPHSFAPSSRRIKRGQFYLIHSPSPNSSMNKTDTLSWAIVSAYNGIKITAARTKHKALEQLDQLIQGERYGWIESP